MTCRVHDPDLSALMDGELTATEERVLRDHLATCPECRARLDLLRNLSDKLSAFRDETDVAADDRFASRVVRRATSRPAHSIRPAGRILSLRSAPWTIHRTGVAAAALLFVAVSAAFFVFGAATPEEVDRDALRAAAARPTERIFEDLPDLAAWDAPAAVSFPGTIDLGGPLPEPRAAVRPLTEEEHLARLGFTQDEVWGFGLTAEGRERLRDLRELAAILADAERRKVALAAAKASVKGNPAAALLVSLSAGESKTFGSLTVVALNDGEGDPAVRPLGVAEALATGVLTLRETSDGVFATNDHPDRPVYLAAGDILVGARQDRVVRRPTLVSAKTGPEAVPVLCCEKNRSWGRTDVFAGSPGVAPNGIRHLLTGVLDNEPVWARIAAQLALLEAGTGDGKDLGSLKSVYRRGRAAAKLDGFRAALLPVLADERTVGFLVFEGGVLLGGDVFSTHELLGRFAPRFLAGYALDTFWEDTGVTTPARTAPDVRAVLDSVTTATWLSRRGAATGREYEFLGKDDGVSGMALVPAAGARPVHISIFPHRKPRPVVRPGDGSKSGEKKNKGGTADPGGTPPTPPPVDAGDGTDKRELEKTRKKREERRKPRGPIQPPKGSGPKVPELPGR
ncbi:MAG: DUF6569 family protein [Planctomycetota bacterium]